MTVVRYRVVYSTGMLLGLGMLWFDGAFLAIHGKDWVTLPWVRRAAGCWPAVSLAPSRGRCFTCRHRAFT